MSCIILPFFLPSGVKVQEDGRVLFQGDKPLLWDCGSVGIEKLRELCVRVATPLLVGCDPAVLELVRTSQAVYAREGAAVATPIAQIIRTNTDDLALSVVKYRLDALRAEGERQLSQKELRRVAFGVRTSVTSADDEDDDKDDDDDDDDDETLDARRESERRVADAQASISNVLTDFQGRVRQSLGAAVGDFGTLWAGRAKGRPLLVLRNLVRDLETLYRRECQAPQFTGDSIAVVGNTKRPPRVRQSRSQFVDRTKAFRFYEPLRLATVKLLEHDFNFKLEEKNFDARHALLLAYGFRPVDLEASTDAELDRAVEAWMERLLRSYSDAKRIGELSVPVIAWFQRACERLLRSVLELSIDGDFSLVSDGFDLKVIGERALTEEEKAARLLWPNQKPVPVRVATIARIARLLDEESRGNLGLFDLLVKAVEIRKKLAGGVLGALEEARRKFLESTREPELRRMVEKFSAVSRVYDTRDLFDVLAQRCGRDLKRLGDRLLLRPVSVVDSSLERLAALQCELMHPKTMRRTDDGHFILCRAKRRQLRDEFQRARFRRQSRLFGVIGSSIAAHLFSAAALRKAGVHGIDPGMKNVLGCAFWKYSRSDKTGRFHPWRLSGREYFHLSGQNKRDAIRHARHGAEKPGMYEARLRLKADQGKDRVCWSVLEDMRRMSDAMNDKFDCICVIGKDGYGSGRGHRRAGAKVLTEFLHEFVLVVEMDEFNTSKLCPHCMTESSFLPGQSRVKQCSHCTYVVRSDKEQQKTEKRSWDRDTSAAFTFIRLLAVECTTGERLAPYRRTGTEKEKQLTKGCDLLGDRNPPKRKKK